MSEHAAGRAVLFRSLLAGCLALPASGQLTADFTVDVVSGANPLTVQFSDMSSGGTPVSWNWDFGDGTHSSQQHPQHTYTGPGSYSVELLVTAGLQEVDELVVEDLIHVGPATIQGAFELDVDAGVLPLTVQFSDQSTGPVDGWLWSFGDGGASTAQHPQHTYTQPGHFDVTLTPFAGQQQGAPFVVAGAVDVQPVALDLSIQVSSAWVASESVLVFQRGQSGMTPSQVSWSFGDGGQATGEQVQHLVVPQDAAGLDVTLSVQYLDQLDTLTIPDVVITAPGPFSQLRVLGEAWTGRVVPADLDEDGDLDLAVLERRGALGQSAVMKWYRNNGVGGFSATLHLPAPEMTYRDLIVADLTGDGHLDLLAPRGGTAMLVAGHGDGTFEAAVQVAGVVEVQDAATADLDGDGDLDLAVSRPQGDHLDALANDGLGTFSALSAVADGGFDAVERLVCAVLDADGDADVVGCHKFQSAWLWRNAAGDGLTWTAEQLSTAASRSLLVADLEADGDLDVVLSGVSASTAVWIPFENGVAGAPVTYPTDGESQGGLAAGDVDGDGDIDLLRDQGLQSPSDHHASVGWHAWDGALLPAASASADLDRVENLAAADLDGDGLDDLVIADRQRIGWQRSQPLTSWSTDVGPPLAGTDGTAPLLETWGTLAPHESVTLALREALPDSVTFLVLGTSTVTLPFKGGVLGPAPEQLLTLPVGGNGQHVFNTTWPAGIPAGVPVVAQHWVLDGGGPVGFAASQTVQGTSED